MIDTLAEALRKAVQPLVTLLFAGALVYGFLRELIDGASFLSVAAGVMAYWFGQRQGEKAPSAGPTQTPPTA